MPKRWNTLISITFYWQKLGTHLQLSNSHCSHNSHSYHILVHSLNIHVVPNRWKIKRSFPKSKWVSPCSQTDAKVDWKFQIVRKSTYTKYCWKFWQIPFFENLKIFFLLSSKTNIKCTHIEHFTSVTILTLCIRELEVMRLKVFARKFLYLLFFCSVQCTENNSYPRPY